MPASSTPLSATSTSSGSVAPSRFSGIDGLRAIAVALVIVFHLSPGFLVGGYIGVDVFFVISGFLITGLLLREKARTGTIRLGEFWRRRARRLLPAIVALVAICSSAAFAISRFSGTDVLVGLGTQVLGAATFSYNWLSIVSGSSYFDDTTPELFRNLWSLAVEEQFYLVWPLIVIGLVALKPGRWRIAIVLILGAASALAMALLYVPGGDSTRVYYGTDSHSFGLAIGAALAFASRNWSAASGTFTTAQRVTLQSFGVLALVGIVGFAVLVPADAPFVYQGGLVIVAVLSAIAIAGLIVPGGVIGNVLDVAPMRWIGERSYGLYLWHWPVFVLLVVAFPSAISTYATSWMLGAAALVITVVAAALSYALLEAPVRRDGFRQTLGRVASAWRGGAARRWGVVATGAASAILIAAGVSGVIADPGIGLAQSRIESGEALIDSQFTLPPIDAVAGGAASSDEEQSVLGGENIIAIGDSVMLAAAPELQEAFPGIAIDAAVSRQMRQAPDIVRSIKESGGLRPVLVLGLGTNGSIAPDTLDTVLSITGRETLVVLVNVQAPRGWTPGVNQILADVAQRERNVEMANWQAAIAPSLGLLARDRIHPGGPITGRIYADTVYGALQRLAELPPLLNPSDYGLSPRPA
jgi:peptidoglycan/LPS O-acetylase OafA/YrhL